MDFQELLSRLVGVNESGGYYTAQCPGHEDTHNSLQVSQREDGKVTITCHANCSIEAILGPLGWKAKDLYPSKPNGNSEKKTHREIEKTYDYTDADGALLFQVVRYRPKGFAQRRPNPENHSGWIWNLKGVNRRLYRQNEIEEKIAAGKTIVIVEGEKDADNLWELGIAATTNVGGSGVWKEQYSQVLRGAKNIVICPDNDGPGLERGWRVWRELGVDHAVVLLLPGLAVKGDVSDWIEAGGTADEFIKLASEAIANPLKPPEVETSTTETTTSGTNITNFSKIKKEFVAYRIQKIAELIWRHSDGWPRRVGDLLFVDIEGEIRFLHTDPELFAYLCSVAPVKWKTAGMGMNASYVTKSEIAAHLRFASRKYAQVEALPHEPSVEGFFYGWRAPKDYKADGHHFEKLLSFFDNFTTNDDEDLIKAMFMTPAWGGLPGSRPAFCVMAVQQGSGKSILTATVGQLYGGEIEAELGRDREEKIVTRLLSEGAMTKRVIRIDNAKTAVNSALIEGLITTQEISGHRLFSGEATRPNMLTWLVNGNNLRLSRDLANRSFIISLNVPKPRPGWDEELSGFVNDNRDKILADIVAELKRPPYKMDAKDRWQAWCDGVLSRCSEDPAGVVRFNQTRRDEYDDDLEEARQIIDAVGDFSKLGQGQLPMDGAIFVKAKEMAELLNTAFGVRWSTKRASLVVNGHMKAGRLPTFETQRAQSSRGYQVILTEQEKT